MAAPKLTAADLPPLPHAVPTTQLMHPVDVDVAAKRAEALRLRRLRFTYERIAAHIGCTQPRAYQLVKEALEEMRLQAYDDVEHVRQLECLSLDAWQATIETRIAKAGDAASNADILVLIKIQERRARLLGLDAPEKQELSGPGGKPLEVANVDARMLLIERLDQLEERRASASATVAENADDAEEIEQDEEEWGERPS